MTDSIKIGYLTAGESLTAAQFQIVKTSGATVVKAGDGQDAIGVLENDPASGESASVIIGGSCFVKAGAAITAGAQFASDASGKAVPVGAGDKVLGYAVEAATASGDVIRAVFQPRG